MKHYSEYDVIVVGAGPCGSMAAKIAAQRGARTILLEEHPQIGLPEHCVGMLAGSGGGFLAELLETMDPRVVVREAVARRVYSPSGRCFETPLKGICMIERNLFDLELALQAAEAGAQIAVNTTVTGLIKEEGIIRGVKTNSSTIPSVAGKVVVAADGIRALFKGIAAWEGLSQPDQKVISGLKWHLANVKGTEPGIIEFHLGSFCERGWLTLIDRGHGSYLTDIPSLRDYEQIKNGTYLISQKLRHSQVLRITGFSHPVPMGRTLDTRVKDGLILAGDGAGFLSIDFAVATGKAAGEVAAEAAIAGDCSAENLARYDRLSREIEARKEWFTSQFHALERFFGLPDEEIERRLTEEKLDAD